MNHNIHTSYFSRVDYSLEFYTACEEFEFVKHFERICHTRVTYTFRTSFIGSMNANSSHRNNKSFTKLNPV